MSTTCVWWTGRVAGVVLGIAIAVVAGCSVGSDATQSGAAGTVAAGPAPEAPSPAAVPGVRVVLRISEHAVGATLADAPAARELAGMLPLTVELTDAWGQAKTGQLSRPITADGAARIVKPVPGGIYYWPDTATLAIYYDDIGQSVPPPGLIRLGAIDADTDEIGDAGRHVTVRIDRAADAHP